jgi:hypothetical protein
MLGALGLAVVGGEAGAEGGGGASAQGSAKGGGAAAAGAADTVNSIAQLLTKELDTPDEDVQIAVADGLQSLAKALTQEQQAPLIEQLLTRLVGGGKDAIGARRGAAYVCLSAVMVPLMGMLLVLLLSSLLLSAAVAVVGGVFVGGGNSPPITPPQPHHNNNADTAWRPSSRGSASSCCSGTAS